jgi:hypothetical protein
LIARAHKVILAGDRHQLPPTTFFETDLSDLHEDVTLPDLDSVMEDFLTPGVPEMYLKNHYRSSDESLFAFSNRVVYNNRVNTYPSPRIKVNCVKMKRVGGVYDSGNSRTNRMEAEAVVEHIVKHLKEKPEQSLGVITFNEAQQTLIEELFTKCCESDVSLEKRAEQAQLLIRNIETAQGEERESIIISTTYAPDANGVFIRNFGPISARDGSGYRRLNVAVTRAQSEMTVYTSIDPGLLIMDQASHGVEFLRDFLIYAESGSLPAGNNVPAPYHDLLAHEIACKLEKRGFTCQVGFGSSMSKIDIAVAASDHTEADDYLLGIMLDGNQFAEVEDIKDRYLLKEQMFKRNGWNIYRVWAEDYCADPDYVLTKILDQFHKIQSMNTPKAS